MLADHPVQRLVGGFSFTNKILLLSSPAHHGWLGLITYGYVGVKTSAHPFPMRLEPTSRLAIHECSLHRRKTKGKPTHSGSSIPRQTNTYKLLLFFSQTGQTIPIHHPTKWQRSDG